MSEIGRPGGISYTWAGEADECLARAGLVNIECRRYARTVAGGSTGCVLLRNYVRQVESHLRGTSLTEAELRRFYELMEDPRFRSWFFEFTCVRAQRPGA